ncbi:protein phosphatase 1 regulatory subunit SDS22 [Oryza brachyantha]|uniref:Protein phosphatase 1 regulatory subunit 7 n=1 Tax=Oryza brachyantha TaxID=4533 RepID=J3L874_ORYBR|nr:protein phosphatase 1 regulatory subunit SDS22 [Oryza brachyantha]
MARLTVEQAKREAGSEGTAATSLDLSHRALSDVSCLSSFNNLERLDLGYNCLVTLEGLSTCANLKWLSVIENKLVNLKGVEGLSKLQVLNAGKNKLKTMDEVKYLSSLGALILNDNNISSICKLDQLHQLNTLVLSKNPIFTIGDALMKAKAMKKLSLSHCQIENIGSSLTACVELKELRLAHNKITTIPSNLAKNVKILNLDLGNNLIGRRSDLEVLSELHYLRNLNLQGNPIAEKDGLAKKVMKLAPNLRIFNSKPMEASSKSTKNSREENLPTKDAAMPDGGPTDICTKKKTKGKHSKQQIKSPEETVGQSTRLDVTIATPVKSEPLIGEGKEKVAVEHVKNKKSKRKDDNSSLDDTDKKASKGAKRMKSANKEKNAEGIDDTEIPFADLVFSSEGNNPDPELKGKIQEIAPDGKFGGLVIDHTKKKKGKGMVVGSAALEQLSSAPEVGAGALSGWD